MAKKEKTILYAVCAVVVCAIIAVCVVSNMGSGEKREKEMKKLLANNWYRQWSESVSFTLYDDGTVTIPGSYGQGKWALVNDDVLKISDFYGETMTLKIDDLDDQWLVVYEMENGQQQEESGQVRQPAARAYQKGRASFSDSSACSVCWLDSMSMCSYQPATAPPANAVSGCWLAKVSSM